MKEINISLNQAVQIWWFITWRLIIVMLITSIVLNVMLGIFVGEELAGPVSEILQMVISVVAMVFFVRSAVNRNYLSKKNGSFRLAAIELDQEAINNDPRFDYKKDPQPVDMAAMQRD